MSGSLRPPWTVACQGPLSMKFSRQESGVGCHFLLQGISQTQGWNPGLLHCRQILYCLSHQGRVHTKVHAVWLSNAHVRGCVCLCVHVQELHGVTYDHRKLNARKLFKLGQESWGEREWGSKRSTNRTPYRERWRRISRKVGSGVRQ